ncbi:transmembrane protein, putative (macronuclear) [Tetrahymena thermophila SB210]|uniref:Transmembrane protein, putative n=1 Tax=Tetrahymena thermophila (strain SB210) TaxID=312017 RepID=Q236B6_TETTS|nr:transmembrane protein, putative [Tetrahymena thermophila SB210]EAR92584.1 transmembrane protein, putative [Tetrahymena thermophila SB210]|eukprot:XP_001012829.1 transmembrane protein, putative [Tetrahymena thermophila SB210]
MTDTKQKLIDDFKSYDFANNKDFQKFLKELQPPVPEQAMEMIKRHWYKRFINQQFEPNYDGTLPDLDDLEEKEEGHTHNGKKCEGHHHHKEESKFKSTLKKVAYSVENYLKVIFMLTFFNTRVVAQYASIIICILAIIRQLKRPRYTKQYVQQLAQNQFSQNLVYMLVFAFHSDSRNVFFYFPLALHYWIGICEYLNISKNKLYYKAEKFITQTRQNKDRIMLLKSQYEIVYLLILFVEIFFGLSSIFLVIFYYNFLKIKYLINTNTQLAFQKVNNSIKARISKPGVPKFVGKLYAQVERLFSWLVKYESKTPDKTNQRENSSPKQEVKETQEDKKQNTSETTATSTENKSENQAQESAKTEEQEKKDQ